MKKLVALLILFLMTLSLVFYKGGTVYNQESPYYYEIVNRDSSLSYASGKNTIVAIIDSGFDVDHPDYYKNIWKNEDEIPNNQLDDDNNGYVDDYYGWDFAYGDNNVDNQPDQSITSHGTNMAGILVRFAPNVTIMTIRFIDSSGTFLPSDTENILPDCINYATENGANVILLALGQKDPMSSITANAIAKAIDNNITVVSSAGNSDDNSIFYPAHYSNVISVGAVDANKERSVWDSTHGSNYGDEIDFVAPGTSIETSDVQGTIATVDGTSASAAIVASLISLIHELRTETPADISTLLKNTAYDLGSKGFDQYYGNGLVNYLDTVRYLADSQSPQLIDFNYSVHKIDNFTGTVNFMLSVLDDSVISECSLHYKAGLDTEWTEKDLCNSPIIFDKSGNSQEIKYDLPIADSFVSYYIDFYDIVGNNMSIGSLNDPLLLPTGLLDQIDLTTIDSTTSQRTSIDTPTSQDELINKSSTTNEVGNWYTRNKSADWKVLTLSNILLLVLLIKIKLHRRR